eukprot:1969999-Rhodomonas_salina.1
MSSTEIAYLPISCTLPPTLVPPNFLYATSYSPLLPPMLPPIIAPKLPAMISPKLLRTLSPTAHALTLRTGIPA